jgi:hypothetical protein
MPKVQQPRETRVHHVTLQPDTTAQRALRGDVTAPNGSEHGEIDGPLLGLDGSILIGPDGIAGAEVALDDAGRQRASVGVPRRQFDASPNQMQRRGPFGVSHLQRAERQDGLAARRRTRRLPDTAWRHSCHATRSTRARACAGPRRPATRHGAPECSRPPAALPARAAPRADTPRHFRCRSRCRSYSVERCR